MPATKKSNGSKKGLANKGGQEKKLQAKLAQEVASAQAQVKPDGYEMSLGELISIYERGEIHIRPDYQRLFRWSQEQKSRLIESILIGIPVPPLFVFQDNSGKWELVDGLQRVSTICEFRGVLRKVNSDDKLPASILSGTTLIPSLDGARWEKGNTGFELPEPLRLRILRARIRVEILQVGSSPRSRYELFQRLNTGGSLLTHQEIRNCAVIMVDKSFFDWLTELSLYPNFVKTSDLTETAIERQRPLELVTKYFACNFFPYKSEWDYHDFLDEAAIHLALDSTFDRKKEAAAFKEVFDIVFKELGDTAFRRTKNNRLVGSFSDAAFEAISVGVRHNLSQWKKTTKGRLKALTDAMWDEQSFVRNTGAGVRGTTRITKLIPFSKAYFTSK